MNNLLLLILSCLFITSCAVTTQYVDLPTGDLDGDLARIYVIRKSSLGSAIRMKIYEEGELIGKLGPKSYLSWDVAGDQVELLSRSENKVYLTLNLEPGKAYYVKQHVRFGIIKARTHLSMLDEESALELLAKLNAPKLDIKKITP